MDTSTAAAFIIVGLLVSRRSVVYTYTHAYERQRTCPLAVLSGLFSCSCQSTSCVTSMLAPGRQLLRKLANPMEIQAHTRPSTQLSAGQLEDHQTKGDLQSSPGLVSPVWRHLQGVLGEEACHSSYR